MMRCRKPAGITLIEALVTITISTMVLLVALELLSSLTTWGASSAAIGERAAALERLEYTLRAQLASASQVRAEGAVLSVETGEARSEWRLAETGCEYRRTAEDETQYEHFAIGPYAAWQSDAVDGLWRVELRAAADDRALPVRIVVPRPQTTGGDP